MLAGDSCSSLSGQRRAVLTSLNPFLDRDAMKRSSILTALFLAAMLAVPVSCIGEPVSPEHREELALPAGKIGEHISALIASFNSADPATVRRFFEQHTDSSFQEPGKLKLFVEGIVHNSERSGGLDFRAVRRNRVAEPDSSRLSVVVQDRRFGGWYEIPLSFEESGERRINGGLFLLSAEPTADAVKKTIGEAEFVREVNSLGKRACDSGVFSGAFLVAKGDKTLAKMACGEASKRYHVRNNIDTKFNLGSMSKMFTAVAIAQLAEKGALSFDDPASKYIDETWLPKEITDQITIRQLLGHTSGLGSYLNEKFFDSSRILYRKLGDYKPLVQGETLAFKPGTSYLYSDTGMLLLGVIIEKVSGQDYFDYVREHVFASAGMADTDNYALDDPVENLAMGYIPAPESRYGWRENTFDHVLRGSPAEGAYSTVRDLQRFAAALVSYKLVTRESLDELWTDHSGAGYGYGFFVSSGTAGKTAGHEGGFAGVSSELKMYPDKGLAVAVLSNYDGGAIPIMSRMGQLVSQFRNRP